MGSMGRHVMCQQRRVPQSCSLFSLGTVVTPRLPVMAVHVARSQTMFSFCQTTLPFGPIPYSYVSFVAFSLLLLRTEITNNVVFVFGKCAQPNFYVTSYKKFKVVLNLSQSPL